MVGLLSRIRPLAGQALKAVGLVTVADKVSSGTKEGNWILLGGVGLILILLLRR